eukprot:CAMPEP_0184683378 /NCGR_PEP_ID=MMETSP0312-20130426/11059_1 /TAXON_ID=31354 /ORGANISM="Compsopogon coeruleus, Strain SAG 36.94" /LENGTH=228 /DNA_ID=CAMNT_0027135683 /DNA_START=348 /DNA_END=1030 /DNA_ORIENTATION=-
MEKKDTDSRRAKRRNPLVFEDHHGVSFRARTRLCLRDELFMREMLQRCDDEMFVITDPSLPDNPITYASPCFLRYTQYTRGEVIGKNCRFLQGDLTRARDVRRIRWAINKMKECTVTLVNYKKDGTAFRNQFFIAPLLKRNAFGEPRGEGPSTPPLSLPGRIFQLFQLFDSHRREADLFIGIQCESRQANRSIIENFGANFRSSQPFVIAHADYEKLLEAEIGVLGSP